MALDFTLYVPRFRNYILVRRMKNQFCDFYYYIFEGIESVT